jgi:hypothetical protein
MKSLGKSRNREHHTKNRPFWNEDQMTAFTGFAAAVAMVLIARWANRKTDTLS